VTIELLHCVRFASPGNSEQPVSNDIAVIEVVKIKRLPSIVLLPRIPLR